MRPSLVFSAALLLMLLNTAAAQISVGFTAGKGFNTGDPVEDSNTLSFFYDGASTIFHGFISWEISKKFSVNFNYRAYDFKLSAQRSANASNMGIGLRANLISNEKKFVPFIQAEAKVLNNISIQDKSSKAIDEFYSPKLMIALDAGAEISIARALNLIITGGFHGGKWMTDTEEGSFKAKYNLGNQGVEQGISVIQLTAGLKYYFSKRAKQRDY